tara:strand:- start:36 stop:500 length:465 start_codon:yes stop_codon:yes gene_type:complete
MNKIKLGVSYFLIVLILSINAISEENKKNYINIESNQLINKKNPPTSTFIGDVYATDTINHFWGDIMTVTYDGNNKIKLITIENNVKVKRVNEEAIGRFATYNPQEEIIEILGDVTVIKDGNILMGEKLTIDLISSTSNIVGNKNSQVSVKINK